MERILCITLMIEEQEHGNDKILQKNAKLRILHKRKYAVAFLQENAIPALFSFIISTYRVFSLNHTSIDNSGWIRDFNFSSVNINMCIGHVKMNKNVYNRTPKGKDITQSRNMKFFRKNVKLRILRKIK